LTCFTSLRAFFLWRASSASEVSGGFVAAISAEAADLLGAARAVPTLAARANKSIIGRAFCGFREVQLMKPVR
jgi:hypothetical protein